MIYFDSRLSNMLFSIAGGPKRIDEVAGGPKTRCPSPGHKPTTPEPKSVAETRLAHGPKAHCRRHAVNSDAGYRYT